jgi:hypothetical protein
MYNVQRHLLVPKTRLLSLAVSRGGSEARDDDYKYYTSYSYNQTATLTVKMEEQVQTTNNKNKNNKQQDDRTTRTKND